MKIRLTSLILVVCFVVSDLGFGNKLLGVNEPVGYCGCPVANPYDLINSFGNTNDNPYEIKDPEILFESVGLLSYSKLELGFKTIAKTNKEASSWFENVEALIQGKNKINLEEILIPGNDIENARKAIELSESFAKFLLNKNLFNGKYNHTLRDYYNNISKLRYLYSKMAYRDTKFELDNNQRYYTTTIAPKTGEILRKMFP